ncbi:MAG: hypothetical protein ACE5JT_02820, partial [Nitrosopumilaceae archaeon]
ATDLQSDPFTQGAGLVNVEGALDFVKGKDGMFIVYNDASFSNIKKILDVGINTVNSSSFGIDKFQLTDETFPSTSWFGGRLYPGERASATFTVENPTDRTIEVRIMPQTLELIKKTQFNGTTKVRVQDPILNKSDAFSPNYIHLEDVRQFENLSSFYEEPEEIPQDASLMILSVNFPFSVFMNKTDETYANDMRISSLYLYDWADKNNDTKITSNELSLVNRGGSWGTVQEIRVSDPKSKIENTPLLGIYPVPKRYSYWFGDTQKNATSMDYIVTASYYKKDLWGALWVDKKTIQVPPKGTADVTVTIVAPTNALPSVYQGFITFEGDSHTVNAPISFAVKKKIQPKDMLTVIEGSQTEDVLYGPGYINGAFDMVNRYTAGDWRHYYFEVEDSTINTASIELSWEDEDTNLSVFFIDPQGRIVQTNVPPGVLGPFRNWPTGDWLGITPFSEGGGFYPIKNKDATSTVMFAPINQTGTYTLLMHSTLFGGGSLAEPITVAAKFSTILPDEKSPEILFDIPEFVNSTFGVKPEIVEENPDVIKYYLDGNELEVADTEFSIPEELLTDGIHQLKIFVSDTVGHSTTKEFSFKVDNLPPTLVVKSPRNGSTISNIVTIDLEIMERNLAEVGGITVVLPNGETVSDEKSVKFDTKAVEDGKYDIKVSAKDKAGNQISKVITVNVDHSVVSILETKEAVDQNNLLLIGIIIGGAIGIGSVFVALKKIRISQKNRNKVYKQFSDNDS